MTRSGAVTAQTTSARAAYRCWSGAILEGTGFLMLGLMSVCASLLVTHALAIAFYDPVSLICLVFCIRGFRARTVIADEQGLTLRPVYRTRRLAWDAIAGIGTLVDPSGPQLLRRCHLAIAQRSEHGHTPPAGVDVLVMREFRSVPRRNGQACFTQRVAEAPTARLAAHNPEAASPAEDLAHGWPPEPQPEPGGLPYRPSPSDRVDPRSAPGPLFFLAATAVLAASPLWAMFGNPAADHWLPARPLRAHAVALPAVLTDPLPPGAGPAAATAASVAAAAWRLREQARAQLNPTELAEGEQPGREALAVDGAYIRTVAAGGVSEEPVVRPASIRAILTPIDGTRDAFLAQLTVPERRLPRGDLGAYLLALVRPDPAQPWRIAMMASLVTTRTQPTLVFVDRRPPARTAISPSAVPSMIANYWQSWTDTGAPPPGSRFLAGAASTQLGHQLATQGRQNAVIDQGIVRQAHHFRAAYGTWTLGALGFNGKPDVLTCTTIAVDGRFWPAREGPLAFLLQPPNRHNWGPLLAPGLDRQIDEVVVRPTCALVLSDGQIGLVGGAKRDVSSTGVAFTLR